MLSNGESRHLQSARGLREEGRQLGQGGNLTRTRSIRQNQRWNLVEHGKIGKTYR